MALADDVARLTREVWRLNVALRLFPQRTGFGPATAGRLAKAAGASEAQVGAWMALAAVPTTQQALAVLDALPLPAVPELAAVNGRAGG